MIMNIRMAWRGCERRKGMGEYTAIIHKINGSNIQSDYSSPDAYMVEMEKYKDLILWSRLFNAKTSDEVTCWFSAKMKMYGTNVL